MTISAYNIEDNELWSQHLLTAVSQVTVAIYVFSKSWPPGGDKRLLQAAIVLFVPGSSNASPSRGLSRWRALKASSANLLLRAQQNRGKKT